MHVKSSFRSVLARTLLSAAVACGVGTVVLADPTPAARRYAESVFVLKLPATWEPRSDAERASFKAAYEKQLKVQYQEVHGTAMQDEPHVEHVAGFRSTDGAVTVWALLSRIPAQRADYVDELYERTRRTYEWGAKNGKLREMLSVKKTKIGAVPVVRSEVIAASGSRDTVIAYHFPNAPSYGGVLTVSIEQGASQEQRKAAEEFLGGVGLVPPKSPAATPTG